MGTPSAIGQASNAMMGAIGRFDTQRALAAFGDWTDRVAKGELPKQRRRVPPDKSEYRGDGMGLEHTDRLSA